MHADTQLAPDSVVDRWITAFNAADLRAITILYAPDARLWGTTAATLIDCPVGVRAYFERVFSLHPRPCMALVERHARPMGDVVVESGRYDLVLEPGRTLAARFTVVLRREAEHTDAASTAWRIVEHHSSAVPDAP